MSTCLLGFLNEIVDSGIIGRSIFFLGGLGCNTKKLHDQATIGKSSNMLLLNIFLTT